jgi:arylsulfatase
MLTVIVFILQSFAVIAERPNIVLIMADDLGWSDLGCYGGEIRTPNIDSLAEAGMRFTQFYNNSICGPTRASLLTGLYCQQTGHRGFRWNEPKNFQKCVTIGEVLQAAGYHNMMVGKWQGRDPALDRGFHRSFGPMCQGKISYFHEVKQNPFFLNRKRWQLPKDFFMTDAFSEHAVKFLDEAVKQEKPFFLYLAYIAPHWPLHALEKDIAKYRQMYREQGWDGMRQKRFERQKEMGLIPVDAKLAPLPPSVKPWKNDNSKEWQAERMAVYAAQVSSIDRGVGSVLEALKKSGIEKNTLVMFLSDNGAAPDGGLAPSNSGFGFAPNKKVAWRLDGVSIKPGSYSYLMPGPHDTFSAYGLAWANTSNTPFRSTKLTAHEGGIRTPLVVRWPATVKPNSITRQVGHVMDFMPTCLEVANAAYPIAIEKRRPFPMEGKSLVPVFKGETREGHEALAWDSARGQAIRSGRWKLVNDGKGKPWQLYDMETDGTETTNLAAQHPERVSMLTQKYKDWSKRVGAR